MAHKKGMGSTRNGRDSESKRLGAKKADGEFALAGNILVRQRGTKIHPGVNVGKGSDDTLYALKSGVVKFSRLGKDKKQVSILEQVQKEEVKEKKVEEKKADKKVEEVAKKVVTAKKAETKKPSTKTAKKTTSTKKTETAKKTTTSKKEVKPKKTETKTKKE